MLVIPRLAFAVAVYSLALAALAGSGAAATDAEQAEAFLKDTHREISAIRLGGEHSPDAQRALIERLLNEKLDLATMAQLALGSRAEAFSIWQQADRGGGRAHVPEPA